ncbi:MAG: hypothetical protein MRY78_20970 [Saprospiraceae bacterium]|nr:hypothetical protein [Saprospiraceae bacterium]
MNTNNESLFDKAYNPILQAGLTFGGVVAFVLIAKIVKLTGLIYVPQRFPWMTAASFMLLFALFNSVFSLSSQNLIKYWGKSIYSFMGLAAAAGLFAWLTSSMTIGEAGSYRWIYIVVTIGYLIFLGMMAFLKNIVEFAQKEEWNHPRIRRKNNKKE